MTKNSTNIYKLKPKKQTFIEALKKSLGVISTACKACEIDRRTYYNWLEKDSLFKSEIENIDEYVLDFVESKLFQNINSGNTAEILFYLKTKGKKRGYIERYEVDNTHTINTPILTINPISDDSQSNDSSE